MHKNEILLKLSWREREVYLYMQEAKLALKKRSFCYEHYLELLSLTAPPVESASRYFGIPREDIIIIEKNISYKIRSSPMHSEEYK